MRDSSHTRIYALCPLALHSNEILGVQVPFFGVTLTGTDVDWNFTTVNMPSLNNRSIPFARGTHLL